MNNVLKIVSETKVCSKCKECKSLVQYRKNMGRNHDSIANTCEECFSKMRKATWEKKRENKLLTYTAPQSKICSKCHNEKSIGEFSNSSNHKDGIRPNCKDCCKEAHSNYRLRQNSTPEGRAEYLAKKKKYSSSVAYYDSYFMKKFGVTYDDVRNIYDAQHGLCANRACGKEIIFYHENEHGRSHPNRACLDHNHETGAVRALLCMPCNTILGTLETKENIVLGLIEYRTKHKHNHK